MLFRGGLDGCVPGGAYRPSSPDIKCAELPVPNLRSFRPKPPYFPPETSALSFVFLRTFPACHLQAYVAGAGYGASDNGDSGFRNGMAGLRIPGDGGDPASRFWRHPRCGRDEGRGECRHGNRHRTKRCPSCHAGFSAFFLFAKVRLSSKFSKSFVNFLQKNANDCLFQLSMIANNHLDMRNIVAKHLSTAKI